MQPKTIQNKIYEARGLSVMLDFDLAELYEVETRVLNQVVKRDIERFPEKFMFQLTEEEWIYMSSQIITTYPQKRPKTSIPFAFTEHGVPCSPAFCEAKKRFRRTLPSSKHSFH